MRAKIERKITRIKNEVLIRKNKEELLNIVIFLEICKEGDIPLTERIAKIEQIQDTIFSLLPNDVSEINIGQVSGIGNGANFHLKNPNQKKSRVANKIITLQEIKDLLE